MKDGEKITGKDIIELGYEQGPVICYAIAYARNVENIQSWKKTAKILKGVLKNPKKFNKHHDENLAKIATCLLPPVRKPGDPVDYKMREKAVDINIYGREGIEEGALDQIYVAAKLPVSVKAALMPDAHQGYGLPIGGVLATDNAVIPYGVGVDIGCRMSLSILPVPGSYLEGHRDKLEKLLLEHTAFGPGIGPDKVLDDPIMESDTFKSIKIAKGLKDTAFKQLGSSGGGNHFVEWGLCEIQEMDNPWGLEPGQYLSVLTHSGSRGLGAKLAKHYTDLAKSKCRLPKHAQHLAWLSMDTDDGKEYWEAMTLAGNYAKACHDQIHKKLVKSYGVNQKDVVTIENHHNYCWVEVHDGKRVYVHRKGATPAGLGVMGIIPGSMTEPGYVVEGLGEPNSLMSASHGAGRVLSRRKATESITMNTVKKQLQDAGVTLIGSGLDEAPDAYKDINQVISRQKDLVKVRAKFTPKIVRMDGDPRVLRGMEEQPGY